MKKENKNLLKKQNEVFDIILNEFSKFQKNINKILDDVEKDKDFKNEHEINIFYERCLLHGYNLILLPNFKQSYDTIESMKEDSWI